MDRDRLFKKMMAVLECSKKSERVEAFLNFLEEEGAEEGAAGAFLFMEFLLSQRKMMEALLLFTELKRSMKPEETLASSHDFNHQAPNLPSALNKDTEYLKEVADSVHKFAKDVHSSEDDLPKNFISTIGGEEKDLLKVAVGLTYLISSMLTNACISPSEEMVSKELH